jgi:hypothetical protein
MKRLEVTKEAMGRRRAALIALIALSLSLAPSFSRAEVTEDESGFYLGLALAGTSYHINWKSPALHITEGGGGVQIGVGYRFNPVFMLEVVAGGSSHGTSDPAIDAGTASVQIFGYYRFLPEKSIRPYIKGGVAGYALVLESGSASARMDGGGVTFGTGVRCFVTPHFSLGVDLSHNIIRYDNAKLSLGAFSYESSTDEHARLTTLGFTFGYSF